MTSPEKAFWNAYYIRPGGGGGHQHTSFKGPRSFVCLCTTHPELSHVEGDVLVEGIENDSADTLVAPGSVDEEKLPKETELPD